jgi:YVTN family beta-propeller protein
MSPLNVVITENRIPAAPGRPIGVTTCAANVFVTSRNGFVYEIDPRTSKPFPIFLGAQLGDVAHVGGLATVLRGPPRASVTVIDANSGTPGTPIALPGRQAAPASITVYGVDVWIANPSLHRLERVESPYTGVARRSFVLPPLSTDNGAGYAGIAAGEGAIWVAGNGANRTLWKVDPASGLVSTISLPFAPGAVAAGARGVWLVDRHGNAIVRVDPATGRLGRRIRVGHDPVAIAAGADTVWVANRLDGTISRIDVARGVVRSVSIGGRPVGLTFGLGALWVIREQA